MPVNMKFNNQTSIDYQISWDFEMSYSYEKINN